MSSINLIPGMRYAIGFLAAQQSDVDAALLLAHSSPYVRDLCLYEAGKSPFPEPPTDHNRVLTFTYAGPETPIPDNVDPFNIGRVRWFMPYGNSGEPPCGAPSKTAIVPAKPAPVGCPLAIGALVGVALFTAEIIARLP